MTAGNEETGQGQQDGAPVVAAMTRFLGAFEGFRQEIGQKMQQQEERLTMLDRKSTFARRPPLSGEGPSGQVLSGQAFAEAAGAAVPLHRKAFDAYLRAGDDEALRGLQPETKAMSAAVAGDGGYLVDPQTSAAIRSVLGASASLRQVASVATVEATSLDLLVDRGEAGAGWANELTEPGESATPQIERISIPLHELSALPKASQRLLDDSAFDIESWLAGRIAEKFARAEALAFISGDGIDKPKGFLAHPQVAQENWDWGSLGYVVTGAAGDFAGIAPSDPIIDLVYALGAQYRARASFVMNSRTAGAVRKMKDADGRFLWSDGLSAGEPARLMGYPVLLAEDMPDIAENACAIAFGDFRAGYTIAERPDLRILRDPFSAKPHVLFYATRRVGGDVSDFAAIKLLRFSEN